MTDFEKDNFEREIVDFETRHERKLSEEEIAIFKIFFLAGLCVQLKESLQEQKDLDARWEKKKGEKTDE
jgi:hypothetical protein